MLTPQQQARAKQLFCDAIDLAPAQRKAMLRRKCGDDQQLYDEVVALLRSDASETGLLPGDTTQGVSPNLIEPPADNLSGTTVGQYRLLHVVGRGGMGEVYEAARVRDFNQRVAIKFLRPEAVSKDSLRRFQDEIKHHAVFGKHRSLAAILDAGQTETGIPYFVMEFVDGKRVDLYCDGNKLTVRQRLKLFTQICEAVEVAHRHAIIHRDLKPSNILVTADQLPVLIDFGIAKDVASATSASHDQPTSTLQSMMTPAYASPEQIAGEQLTTATDVYSLGVILYELLTGHRPFSTNEQDALQFADAIRFSDPTRPSEVIARQSTRSFADGSVSTIPPETVTAARSTTNAGLQRELRGDLDRILLMALRKETERRYATALEFARDVDNYLQGLPVSAQHDTLAYRASKFISRNRVASIAVLLLVSSLILGSIGTLVGWREAVQQQRLTAAANLKTERSLALARQTIFNFMTDVSQSEDLLAGAPGTQALRAELFSRAATQFEQMIEELDDSAENQTELAGALF